MYTVLRNSHHGPLSSLFLDSGDILPCWFFCNGKSFINILNSESRPINFKEANNSN